MSELENIKREAAALWDERKEADASLIRVGGGILLQAPREAITRKIEREVNAVKAATTVADARAHLNTAHRVAKFGV